ncbi:hypothetical protein DFH08DRAFT_711197, partial [Mycena albidolilacea]
LARLLSQLNNKMVTFEFKNGLAVHGMIIVASAGFLSTKTNNIPGVDMQINTHLKLVKITACNCNPTSHNIISIHRNTITICYSVLSDALPLDTFLVNKTPKPKDCKKELEGVLRAGDRSLFI